MGANMATDKDVALALKESNAKLDKILDDGGK
jgi:hypothetical protein